MCYPHSPFTVDGIHMYTINVAGTCDQCILFGTGLFIGLDDKTDQTPNQSTTRRHSLMDSHCHSLPPALPHHQTQKVPRLTDNQLRQVGRNSRSRQMGSFPFLPYFPLMIVRPGI